MFGSLACLPGMAQSVISAHAGVVNYSEGTVRIDGQPIEQKLGKFSNIPEGSTLTTEDGRAEVLLTPGVFLRMGDKSSIRMLSTSLSNARVEFLDGSAIVESAEAPAETAVTMVYKDYQVNLPKQAVVRFDTSPARLSVTKGNVEASLHGESTSVKEGQSLDLDGILLMALNREAPAADALDEWAEQRDGTIEADNDAANKTTDDLETADNWQSGSDSGGLGSLGAVPDPGLGSYPGVTPSVPSSPSLGAGTYNDPLYVNPVSPFSLSAGAYPYPYAPGLFYYGVPILIGRPYAPIRRMPVTVRTTPAYPIYRYRAPVGIGYRSPVGVTSYRSPVIGTIPTRPLGAAAVRPTAPVISRPVTGPRPAVVGVHPAGRR